MSKKFKCKWYMYYRASNQPFKAFIYWLLNR